MFVRCLYELWLEMPRRSAVTAPMLKPDECCPICQKAYATANHCLSLSCAGEGCRGHLCHDCVHEAVFTGVNEARCPYCRRCVSGYHFALFPLMKTLNSVQARLDEAETDARDSKRVLNDRLEHANCHLAEVMETLAQAVTEKATVSARLLAWESWGSQLLGFMNTTPPPRPAGNSRSSRRDRSRSPVYSPNE